MNTATISLAIIAIVAISVLVLIARSGQLLKIAIRFFSRKKKLTVLSILALVVGSSIITGSLAVGDSMRFAIVEGVYDNLGHVDEVISTSGLFNESIFHDVSNDSAVKEVTDAVAPLLVLRGSVRNKASGLVDSDVNIIGYNDSFFDLGEFWMADNQPFTQTLPPSEAIINQNLATELGAGSSDVLNITLRNPEFSVESIYSYLIGQVARDVVLNVTVMDRGLGRLNLETSGKTPRNLFLNLSYLQNLIDAASEINTILVSNAGDEREGLELSDDATPLLQNALDDAVGYRDAKFSLDVFGYLKMENEDVFFDAGYLERVEEIANAVPEVEAISPLTSYFVNNISFGGDYIAYSTVTGLDPQADFAFGPFFVNSTGQEIVGELQDNEIIITNYTSGRLGAGVGDIVSLNYTVYTRSFQPIYRTSTFSVRYVVDIIGKADDGNIMPPFPGIRGKASCGDWEPTWIDGDQMRSEMVDEDLAYWLAYGGAPKAYITLNKAQELWSNDLGSLTTIKVKASNVSALMSPFGMELNSSIAGGEAGIAVSPLKQQGIESAEGVQLLTETFLSFGAVAIIAGIVLLAGLIGVIFEDRRREIGTLGALGYRRGQIARVFALEAFLLSVVASAIGILIGLLVAWVCILLTNTFWSNIVEGATVSLYYTPETLLIGYSAGLLLSFLAFTILAYWTSRVPAVRALKELDMPEPTEGGWIPRILAVFGAVLTATYFLVPIEESLASLAILFGVSFVALFSPFFFKDPEIRGMALHFGAPVAIVLIVFTDIYFAGTSASAPFLLFFASGFMLIVTFMVWLGVNMKGMGSSISDMVGGLREYPLVSKMALLSPSRRVRRTCLAISLFAVVIFTYMGLSVNISGQQLNLEQITEYQGAGYDVIAESSIALRFDLGSQEDRMDNGVTDFPENVEVVQFLTFGQRGGSCSNLRKNLPPKLIGANISFTATSTLRFENPKEDASSVWSKLEEVRTDGSIPAIGDLNTIVWIFGLGVDDQIQITDEYGNDRDLVIVGILENSVFPGSVFVSEDNLDSIHPTTAEYSLFLFETEEVPTLVTYLESSLQTYGMDARPVDEVVKENLSIEWSYMSLFQAFLLFGLIIGIFGLAAFSSRSVEERRHEIGTMKSLGLRRSTISWIFLVESLYIALLGSVIGILAGFLVSFAFFGESSIVGYGAAVPWVAIVIVIAVVVLASLLATLLPARRAASLHPVEALRREQ